jgi:hypothetical protein
MHSCALRNYDPLMLQRKWSRKGRQAKERACKRLECHWLQTHATRQDKPEPFPKGILATPNLLNETTVFPKGAIPFSLSL